MSNLTIGRRMVGEVAVLDLDGKISIGETNRQLHESLRALVTEGVNKIILNMMKVKSVDSSGLGEMVAGYSTLKANGGDLIIVNMPTRVMELMTLTKLYTVFDVYQTEAEGITALGKSSEQASDTDSGLRSKVRAGSSIH
jgi:anti-sigma B factor antagonist